MDPISVEECRDRILEELADLRALAPEELRKELETPGHRIDSQEAECVIATLEQKYGVEIPQVEEISTPGALTIDVLLGHIHQGWSASHVADRR
jgi:hypothetical protein